MVVTAVAATEGLLANWAHGISIYPVVPLPAQIELVRQGWVEPMTFSPRAVRYMGLAGQPLIAITGEARSAEEMQRT